MDGTRASDRQISYLLSLVGENRLYSARRELGLTQSEAAGYLSSQRASQLIDEVKARKERAEEEAAAREAGATPIALHPGDNALGERVKALRKQSKLTQDGAGKAAGLSAGAVARIEKGAPTVTLAQVLALAGALGQTLTLTFTSAK